MKRMGLMLLLALVMFGCVPDFVTQDDSDVIFRVVDINGGAPVESDVSIGSTVLADLVDVTVAVRPKNQNFDNVPQVPMAVFLEQYEVRYLRTDGRAVEGVDVPFRFTGAVRTAVDVGTGGGDNVTISIPIVRAQAKLEPPLRNLRGGLPDTLGGSPLIMTVVAEVTVYGRQVNGRVVSDSGRVTINFADSAGAASAPLARN